MAKEFNDRVEAELRRSQPLGGQGVQLRPKTELQLQQFDRYLAKEFARRGAAALQECLATAVPPNLPLSPPAQEVLSVMQQLMANSKAAGGGQKRDSGGTKAGPSKQEAKPAGRGAGAKGMCGACHRPSSEWGGLSINQHRRVCSDFMSLHPEHRSVKKAKNE